MNRTEELLSFGKNYQIFKQIWRPDSGAAKGCIVLVHGLGEHSGRYAGHFAKFWTDNGFAIHAFDLPGFGKSSGKRGHINNPAHILDFLDDLIKDAIEECDQNKAVLYGHSMGGEIVLLYTLARNPENLLVISTSPSIKPFKEIKPLKKWLAKKMDKLAPSFSLDNGLQSEYLSRDQGIVTAYKADPLVHRKVSARLGLTILDKGEWLLENSEKNKTKTLVMAGSQDRIINPLAVEDFCKNAPLIDFKIWTGLFHEIHNEPDHLKVLRFALMWIDENN